MVNNRKFEENGYNVNIIGRHTIVTEGMKNHALEKLSKIERFHNHIMHVTVTLDIQKTDHVCTILVKIDHLEVAVHASSNDMYVSIDEAIGRLQAKLRRWKDRIHDHHKKELSFIDLPVDILQKPEDELSEFNAEIEAANRMTLAENFATPKIVGAQSLPLKTLTCDEALMKIELSEKPFIIFKDEIDLKLKVLYRLPDGNYGLVQPQ